ncbi:hypothetical protein L249_4563, partial [Ophiocordyceps polyrhachis-furcata BCC 54312]
MTIDDDDDDDDDGDDVDIAMVGPKLAAPPGTMPLSTNEWPCLEVSHGDSVAPFPFGDTARQSTNQPNQTKPNQTKPNQPRLHGLKLASQGYATYSIVAF